MSQFHYGSIKTNEKNKNIYYKLSGLNSTMVRLKPMAFIGIVGLSILRLNSTMVRLKQNQSDIKSK
ncbi:Hypothetical protein IALB_1212 [Ignavibacterium album JCM 16511]|uniref:Uncharacterized protein n=1 Tax=Ignavibacterium album (strain DSM 19864 / JCM 16511 / NBRC 101810 / Mat9-16) TaxID=945713 RepID=I0AIW6_IGNAJ|nr:Hypothetical protein IALB_1212 [Ignavibacterium album JCM 16511]